MNGFDPALPPHDSEANATATEERPEQAAPALVAKPASPAGSIGDDGASSPDPLFPTDRYRLVMPYTDHL